MNYINFEEQLKKTSLLLVTCVALTLAAAGCSQQKNQGAQGGTASGLSTAAPYSPSYSRFTPIKPDRAQASAFNYKVYEFASDNSWISIIPMPPKSSDVVVEINIAGNYDVKLTSNKCASSVYVSPSLGDVLILTASSPIRRIAANKGMRLKITMDDAAPNNYFCNVGVAATGK